MEEPEVVEGELEELAEIGDALDSLREEIRARFPVERPGPVATLQEVDWEGLLLDLRRRFSTLGMSERSGDVDEFGMDEVTLRSAQPVLDLLMDRYWRVEFSGLERLPDTGPCLLVANRSGLLPYDGLMLAHGIARARPEEQRPCFLVADWLITLPFVQPYLARLGGVRACRENAERLLASKRFVIAFPEGVRGAAKVFRERYQVKRFGRGGVVRVALESGVPLVPVGIVGAEEAHPILFKEQAVARTLGLPFLPVTPTFPLTGPFGVLPLPTKWIVRIGEPVALEHLDSEAVDDELLIARLTEELRLRIQSLVDLGLADRESVWG
ncbi:MAG: lysophospholipid acyltransferase family protein [Myxococcota bacterium]|nr:lysophospholipid acyltransferase family protein [Myxococcota bacterium]